MTEMIMDERMYAEALETEGFFSQSEANLLMSSIASAPPDGMMMEIGSYKGRSTRFAMAALSGKQRWLVLDTFRAAAKYSGHSYWALQDVLVHPRTSLLPMSLHEAYRFIVDKKFSLIFIDADHSFVGFATDLAHAIPLLSSDGFILCHDVQPEFPGVLLTIRLFEASGIIAEIDKVGSLVKYKILQTPAWLLDPSVVPSEDEMQMQNIKM